MTIMSYFERTTNISIIIDPTLTRVLKNFIIYFSHHIFFIKMFCHHITAALAFFYHLINEIGNSSLPKYDLEGLLNLSSTHTNL